MSRVLLIANRIGLGAEPPKEILILKWGKSTRRDGEWFSLNSENAPRVIADFASHGVEQPIDIEHQTLGGEFRSPDGSAPAYGWMSNARAVEGEGIYVNVEWTAEGAELIRSKKYKYISPVIAYDKDSKRVLALHSAGLTNKPAIAGSQALVNKETLDMSEPNPLLDELRPLAGVDATADQAATIAALKTKLGAPPEIKVAVCKELGIASTSKDEEIVLAVNKLKIAKPADSGEATQLRQEVTTLSTTLTAANSELASLRKESTARKVDERLTKAKAEGKLTDAMISVNAEKNFYRELAAEDAKWDAWFATAGVVAPPTGRMVNTERKSTTTPGVSNDAILANSDRFDSAGMGDYERIKKYQAEHKVSYSQAMAACGLG